MLCNFIIHVYSSSDNRLKVYKQEKKVLMKPRNKNIVIEI